MFCMCNNSNSEPQLHFKCTCISVHVVFETFEINQIDIEEENCTEWN